MQLSNPPAIDVAIIQHVIDASIQFLLPAIYVAN